MTEEEQEDYYILTGKIQALRYLANEVRLECRRKKWHMEEAAIKQMQEMLLNLWRMRKEKS